MKKITLIINCFMLITMLPGCFNVKHPENDTNSYLESIWQHNGRISISNDKTKYNFSFQWKQSNQNYSFILKSAFNLNIWELNGTEDSYTIITNKKEHLNYEETANYLNENFGFNENLHWLGKWIHTQEPPELLPDNWHIQTQTNADNFVKTIVLKIKHSDIDINDTTLIKIVVIQ